MNHPPMARGVSHLMYVGDDGSSQPSSILKRPSFWLALLAFGGRYASLTKQERQIAGIASAVTFIAGR